MQINSLNVMRKLQTFAAYLAVLAVVGISSLQSAEPGSIEGTAMVRTVKGRATYTTPDGSSHVLTAGTELAAGSTIHTGPNTFVYVSVNGLASAVRIAAESTITIERMSRTGATREGNTDTGLSLQVGSIVGQVKKLAADSRYEIKTPHGVAGIRGTDFAVDVVANGNGQYTVTFTSLTGTVVASAVVDGSIITKTLIGGESWTVGGEVVPVPIDFLEDLLYRMLADITPTPQPIGPILIRPQPGGGSASGPNSNGG
jgi:hypothetical protein